MTRRTGWTLVVIAVLAGSASACGVKPSPSAEPPSSQSAAPAESRSVSASSRGTTQPFPEARTLRTLIEAQPEAPTLTIGEQLAGAPEGLQPMAVSYASEGLTIRGVLHTPAGEGPFPGVVLVHGQVDPDTWSPLQQLVDEQRRLVAGGYVVLVPDLRNHGESDDHPEFFTDLNVGVTADVINAVRALRALPSVDPGRVAVVGSSLGGLLAFQAMVVAPDVAAAFVALGGGSVSAWENVTHFLPADSPGYQGLTGLRGTQETNPDYWADVSFLTFVDRAARPVLMVQGTADEVIPPPWADETLRGFEEAGKEATLIKLAGANHALEPAREEAWAHLLAFLATQVAP